MLIPMQTITKHIGRIRGVIHAGAAFAQEQPGYVYYRVNPIVWVEANARLADQLRKRFANDPTTNVIQELLHDRVEKMPFHISDSFPGASSVLEYNYEPGGAQPGFQRTEIIQSITMDGLIKKYQLAMVNINLLVLDLQGVEINALRGMSQNLRHIDAIVIEVYRGPRYNDVPQIREVDIFLRSRNFFQKQIQWAMEKGIWGDALYVRRKPK